MTLTLQPDIQPASTDLRREPTLRNRRTADPTLVREAIERSDPQALSAADNPLPSRDTSERRRFLFYQDDGGVRGGDEEGQELGVIYYLASWPSPH